MNETTRGHGPGVQSEQMRLAARRIDRVDDRLHLGGAVDPSEYERLLEAGIALVVDLREPQEIGDGTERLAALGIARYHAPIANFTAPDLPQVQAIGEWLDDHADDGPAFVHCGGGFGRAATVTVALLMRRGASLEAALDQVRAVRPEIKINDDQMAWLRSVEGQRE